MFARTAIATVLLVLIFLPAQFCVAGEEEPIVWAADKVTLQGIRQISLYPPPDIAAAPDKAAASGTVTQDIRTALQGAGIRVSDSGQTPPTGEPGMKIHLVYYTPGSVGGRWIGFGGGAAICIVRTALFDGRTGAQIVDIVVTEQVGGGGLFSIGAEKSILHDAARKTAGELARLLGVRLQQEGK